MRIDSMKHTCIYIYIVDNHTKCTQEIILHNSELAMDNMKHLCFYFQYFFIDISNIVQVRVFYLYWESLQKLLNNS